MADTGGIDVTKTRLTGYQVKFGTSGSQHDIGANESVAISAPRKRKPIILPSLGDVELGARIIGLDKPKVEVVMRQIDLTTIQKLCPWWSSGSVAWTPATLNIEEAAAYGKLLTIHPYDRISGTTTDQDVNFLCAVPEIEAPEHKGKEDSTWKVTFWCYPDPAQISGTGQKVYCYIGAAP